MIGTKVSGRYLVEEKIGVGGMGLVYRAHDESLDRHVAIKVIAPHLSEQERASKRFLREAQAMARLDHINIVTVHDLLEDPKLGNVYIIMELLQGASLRQCMRSQNRPSFMQVAVQMARALECAHGEGILHRDIKPENIYVCNDSTLKLMDFGLARINNATGVSQTGLVAGTIAYMAPEQLREQPTDERTDLYALGVVLYEYLTGVTPFAAENPAAVLYKHLTEQPPSLRNKVPTLPLEIEAVVMKLLSKDPNGRFPNATALRETLESPAALNALITPFTPQPNAPSVIPMTRPFQQDADTPRMMVPIRSRSRGSILFMIFALLMVVGVGAATYMFGQQWLENQQKEQEKKVGIKKPGNKKGKKATEKKPARSSNSGQGSSAEIASLRQRNAELERQMQTKERNPVASEASEAENVESAEEPAASKVAPQSNAPPQPKLIVDLLSRVVNANTAQLTVNATGDCYVCFYAGQPGRRAVKIDPTPDQLSRGQATLDVPLPGDAPAALLMVASRVEVSDLPQSLDGGLPSLRPRLKRLLANQASQSGRPFSEADMVIRPVRL